MFYRPRDGGAINTMSRMFLAPSADEGRRDGCPEYERSWLCNNGQVGQRSVVVARAFGLFCLQIAHRWHVFSTFIFPVGFPPSIPRR